MTAMVSCAVFLLVLLPLVPPVWRPLPWALAVTSVLGVGYTRVALGVHWVSDVVGGWLLGLVVVTATTFAFEAWRADIGRRRTTVGEGLEPEISGTEPEPPSGHPVGPGPRTDRPYDRASGTHATARERAVMRQGIRRRADPGDSSRRAGRLSPRSPRDENRQ